MFGMRAWHHEELKKSAHALPHVKAVRSSECTKTELVMWSDTAVVGKTETSR